MTAEITSLANHRSKVALTVPTPEDTLEYQTECLPWSIAVTLGIDGQGPFQDGPPWTRRERP
jgi:hypothetical protein